MGVDSAIEAGRRFLNDTQNPDGAWPYRPGAESYPEPTAYSLLALAERVVERERALAWFRHRVDGRGALVLTGGDEPNWAVSLLVLALARLECERSLLDRCVAWLLEWKGNAGGVPEEVTVLNGWLAGWPWVDDTFSWVEPTSYALLALKVAGKGDSARVTEAERLLIDRACVDGGWNYGNSVVLGQKLVAFVPTTALALLALQGSGDGASVIQSGLRFLREEVARHRSALSLSLAILCLDAFERPKSELAEALRVRQKTDGSWMMSPHLTALSVLALRCEAGKGNVFRV